MSCLSDEQAVAFAEGRSTERERIEAHLDGCASCRTLVAGLARLEQPVAPAPSAMPRLTPGARIGRYVVNQVLGAGAAGIVYEGYDPELARKVAIKIMRPRGAGDFVRERDRLLREARAMARLSHPHVVAVHDVGTQDDGVYLVRECVDGQSLDVWLETPRAWRDVLTVFVAAGRGLAAAHDAGLVHQDFKPENVLVADDGGVRVTDFGMARGLDDADVPERAGTPAFMPPEHARRSTPDPRADQFSFCVALWWALFGQHPFRATSAPGPIVRAATGRVPAAVATTLRRGLQLDPAARHASMAALLDALLIAAGMAPPVRRSTRTWWLVAAALLIFGGLGAGSWATRQRRPLVTFTCDDREPWAATASDAGPCVQVVNSARAWPAAEEACRAQGGYLASCVSSGECSRLAERAAAPGPVWLGLSNDNRERLWLWSSGEALSPRLAEPRWAPGRGPSDGVGCVALAAGAWIVEPCDRPYPFVCERLAWRVSQQGGAYRVLPGPTTWQDARRACEAVSARLATINDADEQAFIEEGFFDRGSHLELTLWLGAHDQDQEGRFRWITGEDFSYARFHPNEPDNRDGAQDCLVLQGATRRWHDRDCQFRYAALCERRR